MATNKPHHPAEPPRSKLVFIVVLLFRSVLFVPILVVFVWHHSVLFFDPLGEVLLSQPEQRIDGDSQDSNSAPDQDADKCKRRTSRPHERDVMKRVQKKYVGTCEIHWS